MGEKTSSSVRSRVALILTNLVSIGCLVWALRDAKLGELRDDLATMNWWWVAAALLSSVIPFFWHALRWRLLLTPVVRLGYWETLRAIFVGLFANEILPFRVGEVLRCYLLAQRPELPLSVSITSALIERVFDGIWVCLCLIVMLRYVPIPHELHYLVDGGYVLGGAVLAVALVLSIAMFRRHHERAPVSGSVWQRQFHVLMDDLEIMGHSKYLVLAFLQSLPYLLLQVIPIYAAFQGYGFDLSMGVAFALMVILRLGTVVPQAPGNLGLFQFMARESLERIFHVVPAEAARFSLVLWGIVTLPLLIGGFAALSVTGMKLGEIRRAAQAETRELSKRP